MSSSEARCLTQEARSRHHLPTMHAHRSGEHPKHSWPPTSRARDGDMTSLDEGCGWHSAGGPPVSHPTPWLYCSRLTRVARVQVVVQQPSQLPEVWQRNCCCGRCVGPLRAGAQQCNLEACDVLVDGTHLCERACKEAIKNTLGSGLLEPTLDHLDTLNAINLGEGLQRVGPPQMLHSPTGSQDFLYIF